MKIKKPDRENPNQLSKAETILSSYNHSWISNIGLIFIWIKYATLIVIFI